MSKPYETWTIDDAEARFGELIERALSEGPQVITQNGRSTAVVVSADEWQVGHERRGTLAEFFRASPLSGSELAVDRRNDPPRDVEL